ncbi:MAG: DUF1592 domain-containing protein [Myxococcota bacterium]
MFSLLALAVGCHHGEGGPTPPTDSPASSDTGAPSTVDGFAAFEPAPATLYRLTDVEWRNSAQDLFGTWFTGALPLDYLLYNYSRVGGSELTIPPADLDLYEAAAWDLAALVAPDPTLAEATLGVPLDDLPGVRGWVARTIERAWRRPASGEELDELMARYADVSTGETPTLAVQATIAAILLSPDFLFRVEVGEPDPAAPAGHPDWRRYTSWEMAGRLASFLTASVPDVELARAAAAGELLEPDGIVAQTDRLLATPRAREAMSAFFTETLELQELDGVTKDTTLYPEFTDALRAEMAVELKTLFTDVALDHPQDMRALLTSHATFVGPELGALYGLPASAPGTMSELPAGSQRGGLLGRAGFLAVQSHNTLTSPTFRGKFVRTRLMCQDIPPPPPGVATDLEVVEGGTLRDQLEQHATDPACASCHDAMDPIGFALEHFDPIGRWRDLDNSLPIDATGAIDGVAFDGAEQLAYVLADTPEFPKCTALQLYRFANAQVERFEDLGTIAAITDDYVAEGQLFRSLVHQIVLSQAFRLVSAPLGGVCTTEGATQACGTGCGTGVETCAGGRWRGCTAPAPAIESCNGLDDDCDGLADDAVEAACDTSFGPGTQVCTAGAWSACSGPGPGAEECNGLDDDADGAVDEEMDVNVRVYTFDELTSIGHYACDAHVDPFSPACHAAANRACPAKGCGAVTGFGPVTLGVDTELTCLDATQGVVLQSTFTELSGYHGDCNTGSRQGGACNAAISRLCGGRGYTTGFGPVENSGDAATIVCTPLATVFDGSYSTLSGFDPTCNASTRWGSGCNHAIHAWCRTMGYESGHGPLENSGDLAVVACVGVL